MAIQIAEQENADMLIVQLAALLHDVDDVKLSPETHETKKNAVGFMKNNGVDEKGVWLRVKGAKIGRSGNFGFKNKYTHYELGYDEVMKEKQNYTRYGGVSISYADGDASYSRGSGDNHSRAMNLSLIHI